MTCLVIKHLKFYGCWVNFRSKVWTFSNLRYLSHISLIWSRSKRFRGVWEQRTGFLVPAKHQNSRSLLPNPTETLATQAKDFRNEVIQMTATRPISEICERYRITRSIVWLPSLSCLRPIRTCFSVTHLRLDENDENTRNDSMNNFFGQTARFESPVIKVRHFTTVSMFDKFGSRWVRKQERFRFPAHVL